MKINIRFILIALVIPFASFIQSGFAQSVNFNYNYDSLAKQLPLQKTDAERIKILVLLVDGSPEISIQPSNSSVVYLKQLIELNNKSRVAGIQGYIKMYECNKAWLSGDFETALSRNKEAVDVFDQDKKVIAPLLIQIRTLYNRLNRQEERFKYYERKLNYYQLNGPVENMASCYHGMAGYYNYMADYNLAISYYLRAAAIYKPFWQAMYNNEMGVVAETYIRWGNDEKARYYLNIALPLLIAHHDSSNIAFTLNSLVDITTRQKKYDQALKYADQCLSYTNKYVNDPSYSLAKMSKVFVYLHMGKPDLAYPGLNEVKALAEKFNC